jgi:hypothetical protein
MKIPRESITKVADEIKQRGGIKAILIVMVERSC